MHGYFSAYPWDRTGRVRSTFSPFSPYLHVFARFGRFTGFHCICMGPNRTCPFHVFSVFPDLHVFARFGRYSGFHCISMGISLHINGTEPNVSVPRFLRFPRTCTFSPVLAVIVDFTAYPWVFHCISMGSDRTCPFHVFCVFPGLTRFHPFWPF